MAFTTEQLATLESAAATGQLMVQLGDKVIRYQTAAEMLQVIRQARSDTGSGAGISDGLRYRVGRFSE